MAVGRITKKAVLAVELPAKGKRNYLWDDQLKGFGVMVMATGVRTYLVQYRMGGRGSKTRRYTIGHHGSPWTAEKARDEAIVTLESVRKGFDPLEEQQRLNWQFEEHEKAQREKREIAERLAFDKLFARYIAHCRDVKKLRTWAEYQRMGEKDLIPEFGDTPISEISDEDIVELLNEIEDRAISMRRAIYMLLSGFFKWAAKGEPRYFKKRDNPMLDVDPPEAGDERTRVLTTDEIRDVWHGASELGWPWEGIFHGLALTAARRSEMAGIARSELKLTEGHWLLPSARAKNKQEHLIPLTKAMRDLLAAQPINNVAPDLVFTTNGKRIGGIGKAVERLRDICHDKQKERARQAGMKEEDVENIPRPDWRLHDIRRTVTTRCQSLRVPIEITEALLNHVAGTKAGIARVYNTYRYESEKTEALTCWTNYLMEVVAKPVGSPDPVRERFFYTGGVTAPKAPQTKRKPRS